MGLMCMVGMHKWSGCKCENCEKIRDESHTWDGCKCKKCGKTRDESHTWDGCICVNCKVTKDEDHTWSGCKCERCEKTREQSHRSHTWFEDRCTRCGKVKFSMIFVEGGTFLMGATPEQDSQAEIWEKPVHKVTVSSFQIGKYAITQELWQSVMGENPSFYKGAKRPVERVNWYDLIVFCNKLSGQEDLTQCYTIDKLSKDPNNKSDSDKQKWIVNCNFKVNGYRLPTEAEWEYAARGGNKSNGYKYSGSNYLDEVGWYGGRSNYGNRADTSGYIVVGDLSLETMINYGNRTREDGTSEVGKKLANELGIFDMSGLINEWCWDWFGVYSSGSDIIKKIEKLAEQERAEEYNSRNHTNPTGAVAGSARVFRGGGWFYDPRDCRVTNRNCETPDYRLYSSLGARVVRTNI